MTCCKIFVTLYPNSQKPHSSSHGDGGGWDLLVQVQMGQAVTGDPRGPVTLRRAHGNQRPCTPQSRGNY